MKLAITANNYENAIKLINQGTDAIILNIASFSCRSNHYFSLQEIKDIVAKKQQTQVFVHLSNFIFDNEINELEKTLIALNELKIDKLMFNDFAIPQICFEQKLNNLKLHYQSNTLFVSSAQYDFFVENNIKSYSLSNELFIQEVDQIAQAKPKDCELMIQVQGLSLMMFSRWKLVSNFKNYVEDELNEYTPEKKIFIKECNKVYPNIIYENQYGTHMFCGYELCCIELLEKLKKFNIDWLMIDTFLIENVDIDLVYAQIYKNAINDLNNSKKYLEQLQQHSKLELCPGFLGGVESIKHLKKIKEK